MKNRCLRNSLLGLAAAVLLGIAASFGVAGAADDAGKLAGLEARMLRAESGLRDVEAIRAVKRLQNSYGHYAELGLWNDLADLFTDDAVGYYPAGRLEGKERLHKLFLDEIGLGKLGLDDGRLYPHIMLQPVVTLAPDAKTAKGRWRGLAMLGRLGGNATWSSGIYENEYVQQNGVWRISELHSYGKGGGPYAADSWKESADSSPFHYTSDRVGEPSITSITAASPGGAVGFDALKARLETLTQRVDRANAETEVANLQHSYGYYLDRKLWDQVADLFAPSATMELGQQGVYVGQASIRRALKQFGPQGLRDGELNDHVHLQTIVTVAPDGQTANARGVDLTMSGVHGRSAQWAEGIFENQYVKQGGRWKIQSVHYYPRIIFDYDKGWAKDAKPAPGPSREFPPDRPPSAVYEIYPKFSIAPFHFLNPGTGRPPEYPPGYSPSKGLNTITPSPPANTTPAIRSLAELETKLADVERKLEAAKAFDAAENLANAYAYYADEHSWAEAASLFAAEGWSEVPSAGIYVGRDRIRQALEKRYGAKTAGAFTIHHIAQPVIHAAADGKAAKLRVRTLEFRGTPAGGAWAAGIYEGETLKVDGGWKLRTLDGEFTWTAGYREGWAHAAPELPTRAEFPPDRPLRGTPGAPFPKIAELPFHYKNPVTGRAPYSGFLSVSR